MFLARVVLGHQLYLDKRLTGKTVSKMVSLCPDHNIMHALTRPKICSVWYTCINHTVTNLTDRQTSLGLPIKWTKSDRVPSSKILSEYVKTWAKLQFKPCFDISVIADLSSKNCQLDRSTKSTCAPILSTVIDLAPY